jgi:asparagine synthase (glutamine-hydrolysing)
MSVDPAAPAAATRTRVERRQIGGIVGFDVDELTLARHARALGRDGGLLPPEPHRFVGEWDVCSVRGVALTDARDWQAVVARRRLDEVEGAFALAWVDTNGALHLVRDAVGERSLFYALVGDGLVFASTLRALLESSAVPRVLDARAVPTYLTFGYLPGGQTLVEGVFELLPGEHLIFANRTASRTRLWNMPAEDVPARTEEEYRAQLRARLEDAVARRLPEGAPVAATLSGGIDSSLVVALAGRLHSEPVMTYSISFGPDIPNELPFASLVADRCGTRHRVLELTPRTVMDRFDSTLAALSNPIGEPLTVANAMLFDAAAASADVVLNGEGGDPCFGGPKNVPMILHELYGPPGHAATTRWFRERAYLLAHRKCYDDLAQMLTADAAAVLADDALERMVSGHLSDARWPTLVNRLTALNIAFKGAHHILGKVDHLSRSSGVLPRSPLSDRSIVDLALRMPARLKLNGAVEKYILKLAAADLVPPQIVARRKSGMRVPVEAWLHGPFAGFARERLLDGLAPYGLVRRAYLEELAAPRGAPMPRRGAKIWLLLSLEAWLRTVLARPAP